MRTHACGAPPEVLCQRVMHSLRQVLRRPQILDLQPLPKSNFRMAARGLGLQFGDGLCARRGDLAADADELLIPGLQHVTATLTCGHSFEVAVPLLEYAL